MLCYPYLAISIAFLCIKVMNKEIFFSGNSNAMLNCKFINTGLLNWKKIVLK